MNAARWCWRACAAVGRFLLAPLVDGWHGLSLTRILAILVVDMVRGKVQATNVISVSDTTVVVVALAAAFGKGMFALALKRWESKNVATESVAITGNLEKMLEAINQRRAAGKIDGSEPTP